MRPGTMMLEVTPSRPTSSESVFDQVCRLARRVLDIARLGIGLSAPPDVDVRMRPQPRSRMPGSTLSVMTMTDRIICSKLVRQVAAS